MRYVEFRDVIRDELHRTPSGLTWVEIRERLDMPYERPCPEWTKCLEDEIGLSREKGTGRSYIWKIGRAGKKQSRASSLARKKIGAPT